MSFAVYGPGIRGVILTENFTAQQESELCKNPSTNPGTGLPPAFNPPRPADSPSNISHIPSTSSWLQAALDELETASTNAPMDMGGYLLSLSSPLVDADIELPIDADFQQNQTSSATMPCSAMSYVEGGSTGMAEKYIRDTAELGLRICRLYDTEQQLPWTEDLVDVTQSLLQMINRFATRTEPAGEAAVEEAPAGEAAKDWQGLGLQPEAWHSQGDFTDGLPSLDTVAPETALDTSTATATALLLLSTHHAF